MQRRSQEGRHLGGGGQLEGGGETELRTELRELLGDTEVAYSVYNLFLCLEGSTLQRIKRRVEEQALGWVEGPSVVAVECGHGRRSLVWLRTGFLGWEWSREVSAPGMASSRNGLARVGPGLVWPQGRQGRGLGERCAGCGRSQLGEEGNLFGSRSDLR